MKKKKKKLCRTWMGYCPIELKAGLGTGHAGRACGTQARRWRARGRASGLAAGRAGARCARLGEQAHGARGARPTGSTGAHPVRTGWASWVLVHPAWFSAWFFDSVFFMSH